MFFYDCYARFIMELSIGKWTEWQIKGEIDENRHLCLSVFNADHSEVHSCDGFEREGIYILNQQNDDIRLRFTTDEIEKRYREQDLPEEDFKGDCDEFETTQIHLWQNFDSEREDWNLYLWIDVDGHLNMAITPSSYNEKYDAKFEIKKNADNSLSLIVSKEN